MSKEQGKQKMIEEIEKQLPDFVKAVKFGAGDEMLMFHQDAFAADYQEEEFRLLGMAVKYAGLHGREITIVPTPKP
jgi:hypothetical protein